MSIFNCCFLTCIQFSQEECQVVWYSCILNFPQVVVMHRVKGFGLSNKAEIDVCMNSPAYWMIQRMLEIWSLVPLPFLTPAWTTGSSQFMYCWSLAWRILSVTLLTCEMSAIVWQCEHFFFFDITFFWDWNESWHFPILWSLLSFPNLWAYWVQHFLSIIF